MMTRLRQLLDGTVTRAASRAPLVALAPRIFLAGACFAAGSVGCAHDPAMASSPPSSSASAASGAVAAAPARIEFVENDYLHALAIARRDRKPIFVDAWAPWCHTCLSMKSYVFDQPEIRAQAGSFVWLSMDTETAPGQEFVAKFPMRFWPTLWVLDAKTEAPQLKWEAAAKAPELARLLRAVASEGGDGSHDRSAAGRAESARIRGERAAAKADLPGAIAAFREALAASEAMPGTGWSERPQTVEALASTLLAANEGVACLELADREMGKLPPGTSQANVALAAFHCAEKLPTSLPSRRIDERTALLLRIARDRRIPLLPDDRSDLYNTLVEHLQEDKQPGREGEIRTLAGEWSAFLEAEATSARTPAARAVFDSHRLLADLALGQPERAIPMLEQSERDFPEDYNPPARLARAQLALHTAAGRGAALTAIDRALALVYGPRKLSLVVLKCDVLEALRASKEMSDADAVASETRLLEATLASEEANRGRLAASTSGRVRDLDERLAKLRRAATR